LVRTVPRYVPREAAGPLEIEVALSQMPFTRVNAVARVVSFVHAASLSVGVAVTR
jgi:hypothetical protein